MASNLPFLPAAASGPREAFSLGDTPLPEEGDMLDGGLVIEEKDEEVTPASSSVSPCCSLSFSFLAQALRHSLLHSSRRRPDEVSHLTGVERMTLSQLAQVPWGIETWSYHTVLTKSLHYQSAMVQ